MYYKIVKTNLSSNPFFQIWNKKFYFFFISENKILVNNWKENKTIYINIKFIKFIKSLKTNLRYSSKLMTKFEKIIKFVEILTFNQSFDYLNLV